MQMNNALYMPFITFIYKVGKNDKTYYGKYCFDYISDDHEGLDNEVKYILKKGLNKYRKQNNVKELKSKIRIGILSFSSNQTIPTYSTDNEKKCFDFYYEDKMMYINGKLV
jgi:transcriptional regulator with AAA-type ATPase domain